MIGAAVHQKLPTLDDLELFCPATVSALEHHDEGVHLTVQPEDGEALTVSARLLVGADGAQSWVRNALDLRVEEYDYQQTAVIANVTPDQPHENRAFERFTRTGPLAMLPHVGRRCGVVWTVPGDEAEALLALSDEEFLAGLQQRFGFRLGRLRKVGRRSSYPLRLVYALDQQRSHILVG